MPPDAYASGEDVVVVCVLDVVEVEVQVLDPATGTLVYWPEVTSLEHGTGMGHTTRNSHSRACLGYISDISKLPLDELHST